MTEIIIDGQRGDQPRPPHENPMAKVDRILDGEWKHDARIG